MKKYVIIAVFVFAVAVSAGFVVPWVLNREDSTAPTDNMVNDEPPTTEPSKPEERVAIRFPGAAPVYDIKAEYFATDGLWYLVNKQKMLPEVEYVPSDLVHTGLTEQKSGAEMTVRRALVEPMTAMFADAKTEAGVDLMIASAYRSYTLQATYYNGIKNAYGEAEANRQSAKPRTSEHHLGLAVDFATTDKKCRLEECFGEMPAGKWLAENAHRYGFILRYPKGSESVTGYMYESWHFRFIGQELAEAFYQSDLKTFEEAYPYLTEALDKLNLSNL